MLVGGMIGNEVQKQFKVMRMRFVKQAIEFGHGAEQWVDLPIVRHIIAEVLHG